MSENFISDTLVQRTNEYSSDFSKIDKWVDDQYTSNFSEYFDEMDDLYESLNNSHNPITDKQLEMILVDIPLKLYTVAEVLNKYKIKIEYMKLNISKKKREFIKNSELKTKTEKLESANASVEDDEFIVKCYQLVVDRVDRQLAYARELIMSAKKIWTARKDAEKIVSVVDQTKINTDLPEFDGKTYIK